MIAILDFSVLLFINLFKFKSCLLHFGITSFLYLSSIVIALPTITIAVVVTLKGDSDNFSFNFCSNYRYLERPINICGAVQKKTINKCTKPIQKMKVKSDNFSYSDIKWGAIQKITILLSQNWKK